MAGIWTMGEMLVEIMRPTAGMGLKQAGPFLGPFPSGAPAIFIDAAARMGHPAGIIGGVGKDEFGDCVRDRLIQDGVNCQYVLQRPDQSTAVAFVAYESDGSRKFIFHIDQTPAVMAKFSEVDFFETPEFFHVMGCSLMANELFRKEIFKAVAFFSRKGARISFDPNIRPELLHNQNLQEIVTPILSHCSVLLPGVAELQMLAGCEDIREAVERLFSRFPLEWIVLKRGKQGCTIYSPGFQTEIQVSAYSIQEVDPTGAGDCFDAVFLCGLLENKPMEDCGKMASAAGALNAAAFGPMEGKITPEQIAAMMNKAKS